MLFHFPPIFLYKKINCVFERIAHKGNFILPSIYVSHRDVYPYKSKVSLHKARFTAVFIWWTCTRILTLPRKHVLPCSCVTDSRQPVARDFPDWSAKKKKKKYPALNIYCKRDYSFWIYLSHFIRDLKRIIYSL